MLQLEEIDPKILGQRLAEARKARGVTQEDVAGFLGYSRPTYIAMEKGERPAKADEIPLGHVMVGSIVGSEYPVAQPDDPCNTLTVRDSRDGKRTVIPRSRWQFAATVENGEPNGGRTVATIWPPLAASRNWVQSFAMPHCASCKLIVPAFTWAAR